MESSAGENVKTTNIGIAWAQESPVCGTEHVDWYADICGRHGVSSIDSRYCHQAAHRSRPFAASHAHEVPIPGVLLREQKRDSNVVVVTRMVVLDRHVTEVETMKLGLCPGCRSYRLGGEIRNWGRLNVDDFCA